MPYITPSSARIPLAVAAALAIATGAAKQAFAQEASEIGRLGCSLRASARTPDTGTDVDRGRDRDGNRKRPVFSVRDVSDLELRARLRSTPQSSHRIQLKLYTPTGHLYQVLETTLGEASEYRSPGRPRRRFLVATATLPLAGTTVVNHSLYGKWKALAFVEGSREPCSSPYQFVIEP